MVKLTIQTEHCKGCGLCVEVCSQGALQLASRLTRKGNHPVELKSESCTGCTNCALVCPEAAITVSREIPASKAHAHAAGKLGTKIEENGKS